MSFDKIVDGVVAGFRCLFSDTETMLTDAHPDNKIDKTSRGRRTMIPFFNFGLRRNRFFLKNHETRSGGRF